MEKKPAFRKESCFSLLFILALCLLLCACSGSILKENLDQWTATIKNCWCCALYGTVFQAINTLVSEAFAVCIPVAKFLLGVGLLFFLVQRIGSIMIFMDEKAALSVWKELIFVFLKAIFIASLLYNADTLLQALQDYIIYPVGGFFVMLSNAVLDSVPGGNQYFPGVTGITPDMKGIVVSTSGNTIQEMTDSVFGDLGIQVQYIVSRIFSALKSGFPLVLRILANGNPFSWVIGLILLYELFGLMVMFPVAFVDAFIMVGFSIIFLPISLALWVFPLKQTQSFIKAFFPQLLASFVNILFGCIMVVLVITMLQIYSDISLNGLLRETAQASNDAIANNFSAGRPGALVFLALILAAKQMAMGIGEFTKHFTNVSSNLSIFNKIKQGEQRLKEAALSVAKLGATLATGRVGAVGAVMKKSATQAAKQSAQDVINRSQRGGP